MLSQEIVNTIECAIPHKCEKEKNAANKCAHCEISYKFIAIEPMALKCSHHVCKECEFKCQTGSISCKICSKKSELTGASGAASEMLAHVYLNPLFEELKHKYEMTFNIYDGTLKQI